MPILIPQKKLLSYWMEIKQKVYFWKMNSAKSCFKNQHSVNSKNQKLASSLHTKWSLGPLKYMTKSKIFTFPNYLIEFTKFTVFYSRRRPAWTDRIIYKLFDDSPKSYEEITCKNYQSHPELNDSDHLPVSGLFNIKVIHQQSRNLYQHD